MQVPTGDQSPSLGRKLGEFPGAGIHKPYIGSKGGIKRKAYAGGKEEGLFIGKNAHLEDRAEKLLGLKNC